MARSSGFLSVVLVVSDDACCLRQVVAETLHVLADCSCDYELILVDDGSADESPEIIDDLLKQYECLRVIRLSRRFGTDIAITAGLESSIGDYAVVMVAASDPPEMISPMIAQARKGADVVVGTVDPRARSRANRWGWWVFVRAFRLLTGFQLPENAATMRLFSRRALNALTRIRQKTVHVRLMGCSVGFTTARLEYTPILRSASKPVRTWWTILNEAASMLVNNSRAPLRMASFIGMFAAALNFAYMLYVVAVNLWKSRVAEGWTTLSLQMSVMFLFVFSTLVVISEYLVHTFEEVKDRPLYHVTDEKTSHTALTDAGKRNVTQAASDYDSVSVPHRKAS